MGPGFNHLGLSMSEERPPVLAGRKEDGTFAKGVSGNPVGRPRGSKSEEMRRLIESNSREIMESVINSARNGDMTAARFLLERVIAPKRSNPIQFNLPKVESAKDATKALEAVLVAQCDGTLTPEEVDSIVRTLNVYISITEVNNFADRLKAIEESMK